MERLTPAAPESMVALCQHGVFTQRAIWQIDSIDPCGVEPGKALAARIISEPGSGVEGEPRQDGLTDTLTRRCRRSRELLHGQ